MASQPIPPAIMSRTIELIKAARMETFLQP